MSIAAVLRELMAAGLQGEALIAAIARVEAASGPAVDAQAERRRAKDRERKRLRNSAESAEIVETPSPKETSPTPPKEITPSCSEDKSSSPSPRAQLERVLDRDRAGAVLEHRQRLRKPLTARAAELLARKLSTAADPNAAADLMIEKGWQSYETEWAERNKQATARGSPPQNAPRGYIDLARDLYGNSHERPHNAADFSKTIGDQPSAGHEPSQDRQRGDAGRRGEVLDIVAACPRRA